MPERKTRLTNKAVKTTAAKSTTLKEKPSKNMTKKQIQTFFERLRDQRPNPTTELNFSNPFELVTVQYHLLLNHWYI